MGLGSLALAACTQPGGGVPDEELRSYYAFAFQDLEQSGGNRSDTRPSDAPISTTLILSAFQDLAFDTFDGQRLILPQRANDPRNVLSRWEDPIRLAFLFGPDITPAQRTRFRKAVADVSRQLRRVTGHSITIAPEGTPFNVTVALLDRKDQRAFGRVIDRESETMRGIGSGIAESDVDTFCFVEPFAKDQEALELGGALVLIKAELPEDFYEICAHEELMHLMGMLNHTDLRPSVLNSDQEFSKITILDDIILAMLYDRRLKSGMSWGEVTPLLPTIASDAVRRLGVGRFVTNTPSTGGT